MIPMLVPTVPERENPSQGPRRHADGDVAREAFDGEIRGAERRASQKAGGEDIAPSLDPLEAPAPMKDEADAGLPGETPGTGAGVVGLLVALGERAPANRAGGNAKVDDPASTLVRSEGLALKGLGKAALPGELEEPVEIGLLSGADAALAENADLRLGARARLKIAHQETHFEPTMREGVLVADEAAADGLAARGADGRQGLLQLLATPRASAVGQRSPATAIAGEPSDETSLTLGERTALEGGVAEAGALDSRRPVDSARMRAPAAKAQFHLDDAAGRSSGSVRTTPLEAGSGLGSSFDAGAGLPTLSTQVAGRIVDAFSGVFSGGTAPTRSEASSHEAQLRLRAGGAVLKTLTIQLQPEHLGTLNISMSLKDGQLTLEMAANRAETARLLSQDRGALRSILEKAGFSIDDAAIAIVSRDAPPIMAGQATRDVPDSANRDMARSGDFSPGGERRERGEDRESRASVTPAPSSGGSAVGRTGAGAGSGARASGTVFL